MATVFFSAHQKPMRLTRLLILFFTLAALPACHLLPDWANHPNPPKAKQVRVLCYNIHHGEGTDGKIDLERIAGVIKAVNPDLVALQEVDSVTVRTNGVDQAAELARLTGMKAYFGRTIDFQGGKYGNAILSKLPFSQIRNFPLPGREPRAVLTAEVDFAPTPFLFMSTHLDNAIAANRLISADSINKIVSREAKKPAILAGDLNEIPYGPTLGKFREVWTEAYLGDSLFTFPVATPNRQIDYILFTPRERWRLVEVKVLDESIASDHRPIMAVLELKPGEY